MFPQRLATFRPGLRTAGLLFSGAAIALVFALDRGPREPERPATASPPPAARC